MNGLGGAWLVGLGIVVWREVHQTHRPPVPANLLGVTGLFVALGILADFAPPARQAITLVAWGLDVAGLLHILPNGLFGQINAAESAEAAAVSSTSSGSSTGGGNG